VGGSTPAAQVLSGWARGKTAIGQLVDRSTGK
jgi:hypothetical protein